MKIDKLEQEIERLTNVIATCDLNQFEYESIHRTGNIVIVSTHHIDNAREVDYCIGLSTDIGYFTSISCCHADQMSLFDLETQMEISVKENSLLIEENICLINSTNIENVKFVSSNQSDEQSCSIFVFDEDKKAGFLIDALIP